MFALMQRNSAHLTDYFNLATRMLSSRSGAVSDLSKGAAGNAAGTGWMQLRARCGSS